MTAQPSRLLFILAAAPLALGLAACKQEATPAAGTEAPQGEPVAAVPAPAGKAWTDVVEVTADGGYKMGNPNAPIRLMEYGALSCSHCAEFSEAASKELLGSYVASGKVSYELRFFMLNALDIPATLLATCGSPEAVIPLADQFWGFQKTMFSNLKASGEAQLQAAGSLPPNQRFGAIAKLGGMDTFFASRGISQAQGAACLADLNKATALANGTNKAQTELGVGGTPTFFVNGAKLDANTWDKVKAALERAGAR
ncbi:MAG: thioredoxin domain-containing protein [Sphingomonadales bacterium]|nr:thioredoxin domain-containing protein [Sphingomonadales bacterium]